MEHTGPEHPMYSTWLRIYDAFWYEGFWLPEGFSWEDIAPSPEKTYPFFRDVLTYPVLMGTLIYAFRFYFLNPHILEPLAKRWGLKYSIRMPPTKNSYLENLYRKFGRDLKEHQLVEAARELQWSRRQVERWVRSKYNEKRLNKLEKFQESSFVALYHFVISVFGIYVLWDKPWLTDISHTWVGFPQLEMTRGEWWYYLISVSHYWSFCFSHLRVGLVDYIHHVFTIMLLTFSWAVNLVRGGSLILLVHECGDIMLHLAKICIYLKMQKTTSVCYVIFFVTWIVTRMGIFPFWIMKNMYFEAPKHIFMPAGNLFYLLLLGLFILNVMWTRMIVVAGYKNLFKGSGLNDERSSESSSNEGGKKST